MATLPRRLPYMLLFALVLLLMTGGAAAQNDAERVIINYTSVTESNNTQQLDLFFTVLSESGQAILNPEIDDINIVLDNNAPVEILGVSTPNIPFYLTLVLDASGSMGAASATMQAAAISAVNNMPGDAQISVVRFNQTIDVLQGFTTDRGLISAAINQSSSVRNSGTCLYDAMFTGLELLNGAPDPARRALIVFTDGRDEITLGRGDQCSENNAGQVLDLATESNQPIPIYTIGLRGDRNINETELRNFADATGGLSAIGEEAVLNDLFQQIVNSLRSQQLVQARLCSAEGSRTATLIVDAGNALQPDVTQFELTTTCSLPTATPTATTTPTPRPVELFIESFAVNNATQTLSFEVRRGGDVPAAQLRVQIADSETGAVLQQQIVPTGANVVQVIEFPITADVGEDIDIIVSALDASGTVLARTEETFGVTRPTPTPTPRPTQIFIDAFTVDINADIMRFEIRREGETPISNYRVLVNNATTGVLLIERLIEVEEGSTQIVQLSTEDIPGGGIEIVVNALDVNGNVVARQSGDFAIARPTATPTATPIPIAIVIDSIEFNDSTKTLLLNLVTTGTQRISDFTITVIDQTTNLLQGTYTPDLAEQVELQLPSLNPGEYTVRLLIESNNGERAQAETTFEYVLILTPTPAVVVDVSTIDWESEANEFVVRIGVENEQEIEAYRVQIVNSENGILVNEFTTFDLPPYDEVRFSSEGLPEGSYTIKVAALNAADQAITESEIEIDWTPPPPPTPTPAPGFGERAAAAIRENPPLAIGVVVVVLGLFALMFVLMRNRGRKTDNSWGSSLPAAGETGVFVTPPRPPSAGKPAGSGDEDATQIFATGQTSVPKAEIYVAKANAETGMQGQRMKINIPFSIGRSGSSLNFSGDKSVSRSHALITFDGTNYVIQDQGSGNGTIVNDRKLGQGEQVVLRSGMIIKIGYENELTFEAGGDDRTQVF